MPDSLNNLLQSLNPPQREAVQHTEGPMLILAGAGSGKTRVLTHRIAYLVDEAGVSPYNILAITFTNKAAKEMRERVDAIVGSGADSIWVSTFHSCCVRILRRYIDKLGYGLNFVIYDADDQKSLMKNLFQQMKVDTKVYKEKGILSRISHAKDDMRSPQDLEKEAKGNKDLILTAALYRAYQAALRDNNALDFDDILLLTVRLFEEHPEILASYQERFQYIMVDEYQDTNNVQFRFVSLLASRYRNLCVVGDDDQSIYKFRGANIHNILDFEDTFPDAKVIRLEQNYRSTSNILNAANEVIANNENRKKKRLWTQNGEGSRIHLRQFMNGFEEAEYVSEEIARFHAQGKALYRDFAVLYRTNAQSRLFEEKLVAARIPYKLVGGINFYSRKEIKDLLCYLRTIENGKDDISFSRIINVPRRGIGTTTVGRAQEYAFTHGISLFEALGKAKEIPGLGRGVSKVEGFISQLRALKTKAELLPVKELLEDVIETIGYRKELEAEGTPEAQARIENIDEFISTAASYEENTKAEGGVPSLAGFLQEVALVADVDNVEEDRDYVVLMTLHSAKGLEFPYVFMVGMENGTFPGFQTMDYGNQDDWEEERRLCYVGITRAMRELTLTCARRRLLRGEWTDLELSCFAEEIPRSLVEMGYGEPGSSAKVEQMRKAQSQGSAMSRFFSQADREKSTDRPKPAAPIHSVISKGPAPKPDSLSYQTGDTVLHIRYGKGVVKKIVDAGRDYEVTVDFETYGMKKMFAGFAKLKKL